MREINIDWIEKMEDGLVKKNPSTKMHLVAGLDEAIKDLEKQIEDVVSSITDDFHDVPQNAVKESMIPSEFEYGTTLCSQSVVSDFPTINEYGVSVTFRGQHSNYAQIFITRFGDIWSRRSGVINEWNGEWYNAKRELDKVAKQSRDEVKRVEFSELSSTASEKTDDIYSKVEWKDKSGQVYATSTLLNDILTVIYTNDNKTIKWKITFDEDGFPFKKELI